MENCMEQQLLKLIGGQLSPEDWKSWWIENEQFLSEHLSRGMYLKLKPIEHGFRWVPILHSQKNAATYFSEKGIEYEKSERYQQEYEAELNVYVEEGKKADSLLLPQIKDKNPDLFRMYPKFSASLKHTYTSSDVLSVGAPEFEIAQVEKSLNFRLPPDIREYFAVLEEIAIEGIRLELKSMRNIMVNNKLYIVLGEFWKMADGDLLLIKPETTDISSILYYCHESNKVKKLCNGMMALLENKFSYYNRQ